MSANITMTTDTSATTPGAKTNGSWTASQHWKALPDVADG